jgi:phosphoglucosamine mutase
VRATAKKNNKHMLKYFGTDGVRGVAGVSLTEAMSYRIGRALGQFDQKKHLTVLVCEDTRQSSETLKAALIKGLLLSGATVYDIGVSTTPSVSYLVRRHHFAFGVMISASHNPYQDNGIKVFNQEGEKLEDAKEEVIESYMDREADDLPSFQGQLLSGEQLREEYIEWLRSKVVSKSRSLKIVVDCANGSASSVAPELYQSLGLPCTFINNHPDGTNINNHCGSTHLESLQAAFKNGSYDLAFAFDGDGDRFMALGPGGRLIDGDAMIFLNALALHSRGQLKKDTVVITVMSNFGLRKALEEAHLSYETVAVGDKNVQQALKKDGLSLGGEQSGHVIFLDDLNTGDGLLSSLKLLDLYSLTPEIYGEIRKFQVYPQVLENLRFADKATLAKVASSKELAAFVSQEEKSLHGNGRILVRASGTEPLLRVMAEATSEELCHQVVSAIVNFAQGRI